MISIFVDEAYAFDMLAILLLKINKSPSDKETYNKFKSNIESQIGISQTCAILNSREYQLLVDANQEVFNLVDVVDSEREDISALVVHKANTKRYLAKRKLQENFFSGKLTESKILSSL